MEEKSNKELFCRLITRQDVANLICSKEKSLRYFLYAKNCSEKYRVFNIKKTNGGVRVISAPILPLKKMQKKLANILNDVYVPKSCVYGFVPKKNYIENAKQHVGRRYVLNIDLKDFFNQIHFGRVKGILMAKPYQLHNEAAATIAQLACFNRTLPQGAPSSPVLTNMVCRSLDNQLVKFAAKNNINYTRYADDITFSSYRSKLPKELATITNKNVQLGQELIEIFNRNNFEINPNKVYLFLKNQHQEVTGLTVNKIINVRRKYLKLLRAILYNCDKKGIYESAKRYIELGYCKNKKNIELIRSNNNEDRIKIEKWFKDVLIGKVVFIRQVKGNNSFSYLHYADEINKLYNEKIFDVSILDNAITLIKNNVFIIEVYSIIKDENGYDKRELKAQGSAFYLVSYGLITSYHVIEKMKNNDKISVFICTDRHKKIVNTLDKTYIKYKNKDIDYVIFDMEPQSELIYGIGDSNKLNIGDQVQIISFPTYVNGNSYSFNHCDITSMMYIFNGHMYTVNAPLAHGSSGGLVLNVNSKVVGIVKAGLDSFDSDEAVNDNKRGFVPIHEIIASIENHKEEEMLYI